MNYDKPNVDDSDIDCHSSALSNAHCSSDTHISLITLTLCLTYYCILSSPPRHPSFPSILPILPLSVLSLVPTDDEMPPIQDREFMEMDVSMLKKSSDTPPPLTPVSSPEHDSGSGDGGDGGGGGGLLSYCCCKPQINYLVRPHADHIQCTL